jgi:hypothetical protein
MKKVSKFLRFIASKRRILKRYDRSIDQYFLKKEHFSRFIANI